MWRARCSQSATTPAGAVMPCSKCCPGADPPGRSVTMAYRDASEPASPAQARQGPSRKSETETLRYACCTLSSRAHQSSLLTRQRPSTRRAATSTLQHVERDPSAACVQSWCLSSSKAPRLVYLHLFRRRGALASSFLLPTLVVFDALSPQRFQCGSALSLHPAPRPTATPARKYIPTLCSRPAPAWASAGRLLAAAASRRRATRQTTARSP